MVLPQKYRLNRDENFKRVLKGRGSLDSESFRMKFIPNNLSLNRFGIIVGSKISKKAVIRNKIRRRISEAIKLHIQGGKSGRDVVLIAKPRILDKSYKEIEEEIFEQLNKISR